MQLEDDLDIVFSDDEYLKQPAPSSWTGQGSSSKGSSSKHRRGNPQPPPSTSSWSRGSKGGGGPGKSKGKKNRKNDKQGRRRGRMGQEESRQVVDASVPPQTLSDRSLRAVAEYILSGQARNIVVLTGAGISTAAGS